MCGPEKDVRELVIRCALFQGDIQRVVLSLSLTDVVRLASPREETNLAIVDRKRVHFVGKAEGVFNSVT